MPQEDVGWLLQALEENIPPAGKGLIFTHNNPDPDAIGAAFGMQVLLKKALERDSNIVYGGIIRRAENREMIRQLGIRMRPFRGINPKKFSYAVLVDTQPGAGNNRYNGTPPLLLVLDHHHPERKKTRAASIHYVDNTKYGSTSTLICALLKHAGIQPTRKLATALLYGIKVDTLNLERNATWLDEEMYRFASSFADNKRLYRIENVRLPISYFRESHNAMEKAKLYKNVVVVNIGRMSNPDMTGEMSDLFARIRKIHWTLALGRYENMVLFSLRSDSDRRNTSIMAVKMARRIGTAGGHNRHAGGQIRVKGNGSEDFEKVEQILIDKFLRILRLGREEPRPVLTD